MSTASPTDWVLSWKRIVRTAPLEMFASDTEPAGRMTDPSQWLEKHGNVLYRFALQRTDDQSVAEDLVQETFLAALKGMAQFSGDSNEQTWLVGILKNKIMDHFRSAAHEARLDHPEVLAEEPDDNFVHVGADRGTWQPARRPLEWMVDPDDPAERKEFWEHLERCLKGLDQRLAKVFTLRELQEIEYQEVCNTLAVSPTNLRVMLYRARKLLRGCLEKNWIGTDKAR